MTQVSMIILSAFAAIGMYFLVLFSVGFLYAGRRVRGVLVMWLTGSERQLREIQRARCRLPECEVLLVREAADVPSFPLPVRGVSEVASEDLAKALAAYRSHAR